MSRRALLILRPEPGAGATAGRAAALGLTAVVAPLFAVRAVAWTLPAAGSFDAVLLTSANAVRHGGAVLAGCRAFPAYAVGAATAVAAREAGFGDVTAGDADGDALVAAVARLGPARLLHLAGRDHRALNHPSLSIEPRIVYASEAVAALPPIAAAALAEGALALLHSPRAAVLFRTLAAAAGLDPADLRIAAISPAARAAAGDGWKIAVAAPAPNDDALLAAAARLCE